MEDTTAAADDDLEVVNKPTSKKKEKGEKKPSSKRKTSNKKRSSKQKIIVEDGADGKQTEDEVVMEASESSNNVETKKEKKKKSSKIKMEVQEEDGATDPPESFKSVTESNEVETEETKPKKKKKKSSTKKKKESEIMNGSDPPSNTEEPTATEDPTGFEVDMNGGVAVAASSSRKSSGAKQRKATEDNTDITQLKVTSWFNQFYYVSMKNFLLLSRRPIMMTIYLLSSVISVILAWAVGRNSEDAIIEEFDDCGTVHYPSIQDKYENDYDALYRVQFSLNEKWRSGVAVTLMALGPMFNAIIVLLILHGEISSQLLGMLRTLGVRDSVYWLSWFVPFLVLSFINSLLGAIMAQTLPSCHALETIYFGGILGSLLFLQLPLISSSFFLAAVLGTAKRGLSWMVLLMIGAAWVPCLVLLPQSGGAYTYHSDEINQSGDTAAGIFWQYANTIQYRNNRQIDEVAYTAFIESYCEEQIGSLVNTTSVNSTSSIEYQQNITTCINGGYFQMFVNDYCEEEVGPNYLDDYSYNYDFYGCRRERNDLLEAEQNINSTWESCNVPIVSESQGNWFKTEEERATMTDDEYFVGCFAKASWPTEKWSIQKPGKKFALSVLYFFPYFHFTSVWGNFLGYTQMPNREFTSSVASLSPEDLAIKGLPTPPNPSNGLSSNLAPQGSTITQGVARQEGNYWNSEIVLSTCPLPDQTESNVCDDLPFGYQSCSFAEEPVPTESKSVLQLYGHMVLLTIVYLLMGAYWAQVFPGGNGKKQPYHFFILPRYWFGASPTKQTRDSNNDEDDQEANPRLANFRNSGVVVESIKKLYGSFEAIKGVSLKMAKGEVTALLGHNGAGKTTLSHVLCCELEPSEGDAYVYGHSVSEDPYTVRNLVGLCKQDDYLWPDLSAKEHLELYAGLRGVTRDKLQEVVQRWLESVDLAEVQLQYSSAFSGGMKRRLSVALSTIGDRPLIILDEPTTGMDPVSRRFVWRHIDEIKDGRVILLTTHAMEEADLLADEVAIMRKGELAAFGTPLQLKAEHGSALQFSILVPKDQVPESEQMIREFFASSMDWVDFDFGAAGNVTVNIHRIKQAKERDGVDVRLLSDFVAFLESDESPVTEYGFSNSSLEEVFLKVTDAEDEPGADDGDEDRRKCCGCCSCCCSCFSRKRTPEEIDNERRAEEAALAANSDQVETNKFEGLATFHPKLSVRNQVPVLIADFFTRGWTGRGSISNYVIYGLLWLGNIFLGLAMANAWNPIAGFAMPVTTVSLLLVGVIGPIYADRSEGLLYLMRTQGLISGSYLVSTGVYALLIQLFYSFLVLTALYATPIFRSPYICEDYDDPNCHWENTKWTDRQKIEAQGIYNFEGEYNGDPVQLRAVREPGGYGMILVAVLCFALTFPGAVWSSSYVPGYKFPLVFISVVILFVGIVPMAQLLGFTKPEKLEECLNVIDPNDACGTIFNINNVTDEFVNCVAYGVNQAAIPTFCLPPHSALLPQYGLYQMLAMTYQSNVRFLSEPPEYVEAVLIPALDEYTKCSGDICKVPQASKVYGLNLLFMLIGSVILLILGFTIASMFGFPIGPVLKLRKYMAQKFYHLRFGGNTNKEGTMADGEKATSEGELPEVAEERATVQKILSPFVENGPDFQPLLNHEAIPREDVPPVVSSGLRKVYPSRGGRPPKVALNSLDLHVPQGQVLGFLGKNGAGKTTALKILAGAHDASDGIGLVGGYDCATERIQVFERLGNCPQFDVVWKTRTVQNHLEFLARLKGLPRSSVKEVAHSIATAVGLGTNAFYHRQAGALSGGMRRRLSIAMSLIGSPAAVILDEPTTGLDPSTRSSIWGLVNSFATKDRSMVITTHNMSEADALSTRIAIIAQGDLKVVGTQQHLKDEFGLGYLLQLNLVKSTRKYQNKAMKFVKKHLHPDAVLGTKQAKTLHINLPRDGLDLQKVFAALYSTEATSEGGINQFLLSQSSLEDVFVALGD